MATKLNYKKMLCYEQNSSDLNCANPALVVTRAATVTQPEQTNRAVSRPP